jgi:WD40 repeat protein
VTASGHRPVVIGRHDTDIRAIAVSSAGQVISISSDGQVMAWDPVVGAAGSELFWIDGDGVLAATALPGNRLVTCGVQGRVVVWNLAADDDPRPRELGRHGAEAHAVIALPDGRVVTGGADEWIIVWDSAGQDPARRLGRHESGIWTIAALPGDRVVTGGVDSHVLLWSVAAGGGGQVELGRHDHGVKAAAALPGGQVVTGGRDGRVLVWDPGNRGLPIIEIGCSAAALAAVPSSSADCFLAIVHAGTGLSIWLISGGNRA